MADHAYSTQLPSMVRKPKAVWPGLVKMGMYQKQIAGDGKARMLPDNTVFIR